MFVDNDTIPKRLLCGICMKVLQDPYLTECCGQNYCRICLLCWNGNRPDKSCPHCRQSGCRTVQNKEKQRDVNELKVHCANHQQGCEWTGELGGLKDHLSRFNTDLTASCGYVEVLCPRGCGKHVKCKDLPTHVKERTGHSLLRCKHCGRSGTRQHMHGHDMYCEEHPCVCRNKCGKAGLKRKHISNHYSKYCPLEIQLCPFAVAGCETKIPRKDLEEHVSSSSEQHMMQLLDKVKLLSEEIETLQERVDTLEEER